MPVSTVNPLIKAEKVDNLRDKLVNWDIYTRAAAAAELSDIATAPDPEWIVTVCDKFWRPMGELGDDLIDLQGTDPRNQLPQATMVCKADCRFIDTFADCENTMVGILVETNGLRFPS